MYIQEYLREVKNGGTFPHQNVMFFDNLEKWTWKGLFSGSKFIKQLLDKSLKSRILQHFQGSFCFRNVFSKTGFTGIFYVSASNIRSSEPTPNHWCSRF
jgi:hypothetical protein